MISEKANLEWIKIHSEFDVPPVPGVYRIVDNHTGKVIYVGSSENLKKRMATYKVIIHKICTVNVEYSATDNYFNVESWAVMFYNPIKNKVFTNYEDHSGENIDLHKYLLMADSICHRLRKGGKTKVWLCGVLQISLSLLCRKFHQSFSNPAFFTEDEIKIINAVMDGEYEIPYKKLNHLLNQN